MNSGDVDSVAQVNTGSQEYVLTDSTFIDLTIKNLSNSPIYYNTCDSRTIEEWQNEKVTQSIIFTNPCKCNCVITVQPGEEKELYINGYFINQHKENLTLTEEF
ncbi:MAG: hypothetical protein JJ895_16565, partial [Balneolaceae bacterium]|nr:hypothetical protein [Balneolaceae bacterium]